MPVTVLSSRRSDPDTPNLYCLQSNKVGEENCLAGAFITEIQKETRNSKPTQSKIARAYRLLILVLILRPFGNLSLAWGMRHVSNILSTGALGYIRPVFNPFVALGIALLILATLTRMALLSLADLSLVLPLTAAGYIGAGLGYATAIRRHPSALLPATSSAANQPEHAARTA